MYIEGELTTTFNCLIEISAYAERLSYFINHNIPKYTTLKDFRIQIGAAYGSFFCFEFTDSDGSNPESTTIGYAANYAAKLQALAGNSTIAISIDIFKALPLEIKNKFSYIPEKSLFKYEQSGYYSAQLISLPFKKEVLEKNKSEVFAFANTINLKDMEFSSVRKPLSFRNLGKTQIKSLEGIPFYADIRGFTKQFNSDDSNLKEMALKTQKILRTMYSNTKRFNGIHIQFQGDRELALFHNVPASDKDCEKKCFKDAVLAAMHLIDDVNQYSVHIGIGQAFGNLFATRIGARGEKDNILIGDTVTRADHMEDEIAKENQIAITQEVFEGLKSMDKSLSNVFIRKEDFYITSTSYNDYLRIISIKQERYDSAHNNYNPAWKANYNERFSKDNS